eukprot:6188165-Pleurochrysis_carterae.AAC.2
MVQLRMSRLRSPKLLALPARSPALTPPACGRASARSLARAHTPPQPQWPLLCSRRRSRMRAFAALRRD